MSKRLVAAAVVWCAAGLAAGAELISETEAARHGLTRPWFTHVRMDRGVGRLRYMVLHNGTLFVQTDQAILHALDAETGQTLWTNQVGRRDHPSMAPGVNDNLVGVVNGSYLYVVNRFNGKILWKIDTEGAPGAGATLSQKRAYVPMINGMVVSFRLETLKSPLEELMKIRKEELTEEEKAEMEAERRETIQVRKEYVPPLYCRSWGRIFVAPVIVVENEGEEMAAWPTDRGHIFVGRIDRRAETHFTIRYRVDTGGEVVGSPTYRPPDPTDPADRGAMYIASQDGFVYAVRATDGEAIWRFSAGEPMVQPPVYVSGHVFAAVQLGGMHCLDAQTGVERWWAPHIMQFLAMSKDRVYAVDRLDRLVVLDLKTGARLDAIPIPGYDLRLINAQTDRIYLADRTGLLVCLHEVGLSEPIQHVVRAAPEKKPPAKPEAKQPPQQPAGPPGPSPFGQPGANPFEAPGAKPAGQPPLENPFQEVPSP